MGYDLHITRVEDWSNDDNQISAQEWLELVKEDPELIPSPEHGEYFVIWRGTSYYPETWFNWQNGNIYTKNPDKATLWKLYQMAQKLNAQVQGDDGETWGTPDIEAFVDPEIPVPPSQTRKWNSGKIKAISKYRLSSYVSFYYLEQIWRGKWLKQEIKRSAKTAVKKFSTSIIQMLTSCHTACGNRYSGWVRENQGEILVPGFLGATEVERS